MINPYNKAFNSNLQRESIYDNIKKIKDISSIEVFQTALVLDVDRQGGKFIINRSGNEGIMKYISIPMTLKVRLKTNYYNGYDGDTSKLPTDEYVDSDECYLLPLHLNKMDIPERGEEVLCFFNYPYSDTNSITTGYWICRKPRFATRDLPHVYKRLEASQGREVTHSTSVIYSGARPSIIDREYDIKPNWNYEPFPEVRRFKPGDLYDLGKSNTLVHHSFGAHEQAEKRGYIEIITEADYINNVGNNALDIEHWDWNEQHSDDEIKQYQQMKQIHSLKVVDPYKKTSDWEYLNSKGVRLLLATRECDPRIWHKDIAKDWTGTYSNIQLLYDKNYGEEGAGQFCGNEIEGTTSSPVAIHDSISFDTLQGDVTSASANLRGIINIDDFVSTLYAEAQRFMFVSRDGGDINHAVLGEEMSRWMIRMCEVVLHLNRTCDILRDRLYKLGNDFKVHFHISSPAQTNVPLGSPETPAPVQYIEWYQQTVKGSVADDSDNLTEQGNDSLSTDTKKRITDERKQLEELIQDTSNLLSKTHSIN